MQTNSIETNGAVPQAGMTKDTTTATFREDVLTESMKQPVLVDFWAPWCEPCKQLGPQIEKAVSAAGGAVKLVKMDIEKYPQIAGQLGIQSIPAVIAFDKGQPVDGFVGAVPESQVKAFIEKIAGKNGAGGLDEFLAEAEARAQDGDATAAAELYGAILAKDPENARAVGGLVRIQVELGALEQARRILDSVPAAKANDPAIATARAALELAEQAASIGDIGELQRAVEANPKDHQARFDLAIALNARDKREEATDHLITIIKQDRKWHDDGARKQLIQFFEAWGPMDEATVAGRRKLSALLFS